MNFDHKRFNELIENDFEKFNEYYSNPENLPKVTIHSLIQDDQSKFYQAQLICKCGNDKWIDSTLKMCSNPTIPFKKVHRCESCNEVRISHKL